MPEALAQAARVGEAVKEAAWALRSRPVALPPPAAPPDRAALAGAVIRWPDRYGWAPTGIWVDPLRDGLAAWVRIERAALPQTHDGVVMAEWVAGGRAQPFAIDYADSPELNVEAVRAARLYFKLQHRRGGYGEEHVVPGGYVASRPRFRRLLGGLRRLRDRDVRRFDVYGRFSEHYANGVRRRAVELLKAQRAFAYEGGLRTTSYLTSLREAAEARVCLDLPGNGPYCHRLVEYLAMGGCVVAPAHPTEMPVPLEDGVHLHTCRADLADLVDVCARVVADRELQAATGAAARAYYDRHLAPGQLGARYAGELATRLGT